jgi:putative hydrolase of HD superfamily
MQPWIDSMVAAVTTETGKRLAAAAQELHPGSWWAEFAANFDKNSRQRKQ